MNKELPYFERIKIFEVDNLPTLEQFFKYYYTEWKTLIGFFIFILPCDIQPKAKKRTVIYVTSPVINSPIYNLCSMFCKHEISQNELHPYLLN